MVHCCPTPPTHYSRKDQAMDARRNRRTKDRARKIWYALYRQLRFARWMGFANGDPATALAMWQDCYQR